MSSWSATARPTGPACSAGARWVDTASPTFSTAATDADTMALLHFTSGTTGRPKGAIHVHGAVLAHAVTGRYALDLHDDDVFWCTADPGWVTGTSYGIIAPLVAGVTNVVVEAEFDAPTWYAVLQERAGQRLVHGAHGDPHDDEARRRCGEGPRPVGAALHGQRRRTAEPRGRGLGPRGVRPALPRQLVADRDRRHHDLELRGHGHQARLDGQAAAGHQRRHRAPHRRRPCRVGHRTRRRRRAGAAHALAVDDARLPGRGRALPQVLRRRLVPHRRPGARAMPTATSGSSAAPTT